MPSYVRAQVTLQSGTGVPEDNITNTLHCVSETLDAAACAADFHGSLTTFYQAIDASVINGSMVLPTLLVKYYDLTDPAPRVPILEDDITCSMAVGASYPPEVAICLSFQGPLVSGTSPARRRGRIYLGPVDADAGTTVSGRVNVQASVLTTIRDAAIALAGHSPATEAAWAVFSPTLAGPAPWSEGVLDSAMTVVTNGWIDNAFDTQRRRGTDSTSRTLWT